MPSFSEALSGALSARYAPGLARSTVGMMEALDARLGGAKGSRAATARAIGIPRSTYDHWHRGRPPTGANRVKLDAAYQRFIVGPMIQARIEMLGYPRVIAIHAVVTPNGDPKYRNKKQGRGGAEGDRVFRAGGMGRGGINGLPVADMARMVAAWAAGRDPAPHAIRAILSVYTEFSSIAFEGDNVNVWFE